MAKKQEDTDIDQYLYPQLEARGIAREFIKRNTSTGKTGSFRGDLWISTERYDSPNFEKRIIALIECKTHKCIINDDDWNDAVTQGKNKATLHGLNTFWVSNTNTVSRCYNRETLEEIKIDGKVATSITSIPVLRAIETQVNSGNSEVLVDSFSSDISPDPKQFRSALWNIRQIFRAAGVSKGSEDSMIKTTLTFGILKLISEQQKISETIQKSILLWDDWREKRLDREITNTIDDLLKLKNYKHLHGCLYVDDKLNSESCKQIMDEIKIFNLLGSDFDFFGLIYESMANSQIKKDFGEFYTPRHIIRTMVKLLLKDEIHPRPLKICDPACGTGGFLVEAFLYLQRIYSKSDELEPKVLHSLKNATFYGFDTNYEVAIPFAKTNMMMAGDGGANIQQTTDSLISLPENEYDFVLANVPYGKYDGNGDITNFSYTNQHRYELLFLEKIVKSLVPGGEAAVIVPDGLIESTIHSGFRQKLLHDVDIKVIVSLPSSVFKPYTAEKTYIIFFRRKRPSEQGKLQSKPIWHFIIDEDGFKKGQKRYPINDNDIPFLEDGFCKLEIKEKCGFVDISKVNNDSYYSLCSEYYIRVPFPIDISESEFERMLDKFETILSHFEEP